MCGGEIVRFITGRCEWEHLDPEHERLCDLPYPAGRIKGDHYDEQGNEIPIGKRTRNESI